MVGLLQMLCNIALTMDIITNWSTNYIITVEYTSHIWLALMLNGFEEDIVRVYPLSTITQNNDTIWARATDETEKHIHIHIYTGLVALREKRLRHSLFLSVKSMALYRHANNVVKWCG